MKIKTTFLLVALVAVAFMSYGFFGDNPITKTYNATGNSGPKVVNGPALDAPLSALSESFEGVTFPPAGWVKLSPLGRVGWTRQTVGTTPVPGFNGGFITAPVGGGSAVAHVSYTSPAAQNSEWLITPQITNVQADDSLKFWVRYWPDQYEDSLLVKISTTTQTVAAMTTTLMAKRFNGSADSGWVQFRFRMGSTVPAGSNIYIGFLESYYDGSSFALDLVSYVPAAAPPSGPTTWYEQTTPLTTSIYGVSAPDINNVWAVGAGGKVIRTTNGGTWTAANGNLAASDLYAVWAFDANTALVTNSPSATNVFRTTNGGTNWTQVFTQAGGFLDGFYFKDANNGIMMGDAVGGRWSLWRTTNGGVNWDSTGMNVPSTEASWTNSLAGIGDNVWFGTNSTKIYKSTNFGTTWTSSASATNADTYSLWFNDVNNGMGGGATSLVQTTNGGTAWTINATLPTGTGTLQALCGNGTSWWAARWASSGASSIIYQSTNNGATWTTATTSPAANIHYHMTVARTGSPYIYCGNVNGTITKYGGLFTGVSPVTTVADNYSLSQNYPNPFNPSTSISFAIPQNGFVSLKVYNMLGKEVATLVNGSLNAGQHSYNFNASNLASGVYFYKLEAGNFSEVKKMSLIK